MQSSFIESFVHLLLSVTDREREQRDTFRFQDKSLLKVQGYGLDIGVVKITLRSIKLIISAYDKTCCFIMRDEFPDIS